MRPVSTVMLVWLVGSLIPVHPVWAEKPPVLLQVVWSDDNPHFLEPSLGLTSNVLNCDPRWDCDPGTALKVTFKFLRVSETEIQLSFHSTVQQSAAAAPPAESDIWWTELSVTNQVALLHPTPAPRGFPPLEVKLVPRAPREWNTVSVLSHVPTVDVREIVSQERGSVSVRLVNRNRLAIVGLEFAQQLPEVERFQNGGGYFYMEPAPGESFAQADSAWEQEIPVSRRYYRTGNSVELDKNHVSVRVLTCAKFSDGSVAGKCVSHP